MEPEVQVSQPSLSPAEAGSVPRSRYANDRAWLEIFHLVGALGDLALAADCFAKEETSKQARLICERARERQLNGSTR